MSSMFREDLFKKVSLKGVNDSFKKVSFILDLKAEKHPFIHRVE